MFVKTDYHGCEYITDGTVYECQDGGDGYIEITDDSGSATTIGMWSLIEELHEPQECFDAIGTWVICDKNGNPA